MTIAANVMQQKWDGTDRFQQKNRGGWGGGCTDEPSETYFRQHLSGLCVCSVQSWSMLQDEGLRAVTQSYLQVVISPSSLVVALRVTNGGHNH